MKRGFALLRDLEDCPTGEFFPRVSFWVASGHVNCRGSKAVGAIRAEPPDFRESPDGLIVIKYLRVMRTCCKRGGSSSLQLRLGACLMTRAKLTFLFASNPQDEIRVSFCFCVECVRAIVLIFELRILTTVPCSARRVIPCPLSLSAL